MANTMKLLSSTVALFIGASVATAEPATYPTPEAAIADGFRQSLR